jgi:hypothetical protein
MEHHCGLLADCQRISVHGSGHARTLTTGATYGAHAQGCINAMKQSPWWRQFRAKTMFYGSGQDGNSAVETDMVNIAPDLDGTGYAPYNRGFEASAMAITLATTERQLQGRSRL